MSNEHINIMALIEPLKKWLPSFSWKTNKSSPSLDLTSKDKLSEPLPLKLINRLNDKLLGLPIQNYYQQFILENIISYTDKWLKDSESSLKNCLVINDNPVGNFGNVVSRIFENIDQFSSYPESYYLFNSIINQEDRKIKLNYFQEELSKVKNRKEKTVVIIPDLSDYFLRTVQGLEILEKLLNFIDEDSEKLWLIGCNHWLWLFLTKIYRWDAYVQKSWNFPKLSQEDLQNLLEPVLNLLEFNWEDLQNFSLNLSNQNENQVVKIDNLKDKYFQTINNLSEGCLSIASQLCFSSLFYITDEDNPVSYLKLNYPSFPNFPSISQEDRYLLFALGLHHCLNKYDLALILGDDPIFLTSQIECLINAKLMIFMGNNLILNPIYFYQLNQDLKDNHFLV